MFKKIYIGITWQVTRHTLTRRALSNFMHKDTSKKGNDAIPLTTNLNPTWPKKMKYKNHCIPLDISIFLFMHPYSLTLT